MKAVEPKNPGNRVIKRRPQAINGLGTARPFFSEANRQTKPFFSSEAGSENVIQTKLTIGQPGDKHEVEADAMADKVVQRLQSPKVANPPFYNPSNSIAPVQTKCADCAEEEVQKKEEEAVEEEAVQPKLFLSPSDKPEDELQLKCSACDKEVQAKQTAPGLPAGFEDQLKNSKGGGNSLPLTTSNTMSQAFGRDFSGVKIHTDAQAVKMNREINAQAFTHGSDIYFNQGKYDTQSRKGQHLLAHELTHVVQQGGGKKKSEVSRQSSTVIRRDPDKEKQKDSGPKKIIIKKNGHVLVRTDWLMRNIDVIVNNQIYSSKVLFEVLKVWKEKRLLGWIKDSEIKDAAAKISIPGPIDPTGLYYKITGFEAQILSYFTLPLAAEDIQILATLDYKMIILIKGSSIPKRTDSKSIQRLVKRVESVIKSQTGESTSSSAKSILSDALVNQISVFEPREDKTLVVELSDKQCNELFGDKAASGKTKWEKYVDKLIKQNKLLLKYKKKGKGSSSSKKKKGRKIPKWAKKLRKEVRALIAETREKDPKTPYLPDKFYVAFSEKTKRWLGVGIIKATAGTKKLRATVSISRKEKGKRKVRDAKQVLKNLRIKLGRAETAHEIRNLKKAKVLLDDDHLWAEQVRQELWKLTMKAQKKRGRQKVTNLPDILSLFPEKNEDNILRVFLVIGVRVHKTDAEGVSTLQLRKTTLPFPLKQPKEGAEAAYAASLFPSVRKIAAGLRSNSTSKSTKEKIKSKDHQVAFPAEIVAKDIRKDKRVVTKGEIEFFMSLSFGNWDNSSIAKFGESWASRYTVWRIIPIPDDFKIPSKEEEKDSEKEGQDWSTRRANLQAYFTTQKDSELYKPGDRKASYGNDKLLKIPAAEGTYLVHATCQITPSEERFIAPSTAVYVFKAVDGYKLAEAESNKRLEESKKAKRESMSLYETTENDLENTRQAQFLLKLLQDYLKKRNATGKSLSELWAGDKYREELFKMWYGLEQTPPKQRDLGKKITDALSELKKAKKSLGQLNKRIGKYKKEFKPGHRIYTPIATLASEVSGKTHPFLMMLGEAKDSGISTKKYVLVDMSNPQKSKKYYGQGSTTNAAIRAAFRDFAKNNDYGEGYIAYLVPGVFTEVQKVRSKPGFRKRVMNALSAIAMVGGILALILGAAATGGGSLALLATVLGVAAGISGAVVAAENIRERSENYRLSYDAEFFLDVVGIAGAAASLIKIAASAGRLTKVVKTSKGLQVAGEAGKTAKRAMDLYKLEKALFIYSLADFGTNAVFTPLKLIQDLKKIDESDLDDKTKAAMKQEVIANGLLSGFMIAFSGLQIKSDLKALRISEMGAMALKNEANYIKSLKNNNLDIDSLPKSSKKTGQEAVDVETPPTKQPKEPGESSKSSKDVEGDGSGANLPPKVPKDKGSEGGGIPPEGPKSKAWDDPSLTENEFITMGSEMKNPPKSWPIDPKAKAKFLREQFRKGLRFHPKKRRWVKLFDRVKVQASKAVAKLSPKQREVVASRYVKENEAKLLAGDTKTLQGLLDKHGNWKDLINYLRRGSKAHVTIAEKLGAYRQQIATEIINSRGGRDHVDALPGASKNPESDIDLNFLGQKAGHRMLQAEAQMDATYGPDWREKFRMNFFTDVGRLTRYAAEAQSLPKAKRASKDAEINSLTAKYSFAKMLRYAKGNKTAQKRIHEMIRAAGVDLEEVRALSKITKKQGETRRKELHREIDALDSAYQKAEGESKLKLAEQITKKQMEANFLTNEAYIGPGAVKDPRLPLTQQEAYQSMLSQMPEIEHILREANGDIVKAMREYEIYKYMYRFSKANKDPQMDLFYDELPKQISKINRVGAKGFSDDQIRSLWSDFQNYAYRALSNKRIDAAIEAGGKVESLGKRWNDPDLSLEEMKTLYRRSGVKSKQKMKEGELNAWLERKYKEGSRWDDDTRKWRKPFKKDAAGRTKVLSYDDIKGMTPVPEDLGIPATKLGFDQERVNAFKDHLDDAAVTRIKKESTYDKIKGQLAEEISNKAGREEAAKTKPKKGGEVKFYRGDQVSGHAPTSVHGGAKHAQLTDGMVAEIKWKGNNAELHIHRIYETKSGEGSSKALPQQVELDMERITYLGMFLWVTKPNGKQGWHYFRPSDISMRSRSRQKDLVKGFIPSDVTETTHKDPTRAYTAKKLAGVSSEDLHLASLMILRKTGKSKEQLSLPGIDEPTVKKKELIPAIAE